jgi:hypothetical protein
MRLGFAATAQGWRSLMPWLSTLLVRLHPPAWRARYGDEMLALLEGRHLRMGELVDLLRSAAREQLWPTVGARNARRAVMVRAATALALAGMVFVLALSLLRTASSGRWQNPVATALSLGLNLIFMDPVGALRWLVPFWLTPMLIAIVALAAVRRLSPRARTLHAAMATLTPAIVGSTAVLTVHGAWSMNLVGSALPQALVLVAGSGAIGLTTWWIATGPGGAVPADHYAVRDRKL